MSGRDSIYKIDGINFELDKCDNYVKFIEEYNETDEILLFKFPKISDDARDDWQKRINCEILDNFKHVADLVRSNLKLTIYAEVISNPEIIPAIAPSLLSRL